MGDVEEHLKDCGEVARDDTKSAKSRSIARTSIKICHGVIDLKEENKRLSSQIVELKRRLLKKKLVKE